MNESPASSPAPSDGRDIRAILAEIATNASLDNPYLERHTLETKRAELARLAEQATPLERWRLHRELGRQEMRVGSVERAVEHYAAAAEALEELRPLLNRCSYMRLKPKPTGDSPACWNRTIGITSSANAGADRSECPRPMLQRMPVEITSAATEPLIGLAIPYDPKNANAFL